MSPPGVVGVQAGLLPHLKLVDERCRINPWSHCWGSWERWARWGGGGLRSSRRGALQGEGARSPCDAGEHPQCRAGGAGKEKNPNRYE